MIRIPYIPLIYPDEAIGSFITRFITYNGKSVWHKIARDIGIESASTHQPARADQRIIEFILNEAGHTPEHHARNLTTLPFYQSFNNTRRTPFNLQPSKNSKEANTIKTIGFLPSRNQPGVKLCQGCIADDIKKFGEPYIHRAHQLPTSLICRIHQFWLISNCPNCRLTAIPFSSMILRHFPQKCECGYIFSDEPKRNTTTGLEEIKMLADFGEQMLSIEPTSWTREQLTDVLKKFLDIPKHSISTIYKSHLEHHYKHTSPTSSGNIILAQYHSDFPLKLHGNITGFRGEEYSALFASLGFTPYDLKTAVDDDYRSSVDRIVFSDTDPKALATDVDFAESVFQHFIKENPEKTASHFSSLKPRIYWILKLKKPEALAPFSRKRSIPTIISDREFIVKKYKNLINPPGEFKNRDTAILRAQIRDNKWIKQFLLKIKSRDQNKLSQRLHKLKIKKDNLSNNQTKKVAQAINTALRIERKPKKISYARLVEISALPYSVVVKTMKSNQPLLRVLETVNADKVRRTVLWAAQALSICGEKLDVATTMLVAGVNTTAKNRITAEYAIDLASRGLARAAVKQSVQTDPIQQVRFRAAGLGNHD